MATNPPPAATAPSLVALVRGLILAFAAALVTFGIAAADQLSASDVAPFVPAGLLGLRVAEGWIFDQLRGQPKQAGPLGGAPARVR